MLKKLFEKFILWFPKAPKLFVPIALTIEVAAIFVTFRQAFQDLEYV